MSNAKRWCFVHDDDGHNYLIPAKEIENFKEWLETWEEDRDWTGKHYEHCRCDSPSTYSFVDPKRDL